ncbi:MAG: nitrous oxide reductase accessory protein NosL, partial [Haloferacaceae archaeon]
MTRHDAAGSDEHPHTHGADCSTHTHGRHTRRRVLAALAGTTAFGLAGCSGGPGGRGTTTGTAAETTTDAGTPPPESTESETERDVTAPAEVSADASCAVCGMSAAKFPEWNAQVSFEDGARVHVCTPGCFVAYRAAPNHFTDGRTWDGVAGAWVRDYGTADLVDATAASFVLEGNRERIDAPMGANPLPFESEGDAVAYTDRYDDLTAHDVVGLDAFDVPLARTYRAKFLPETGEAAATDRVEVPEGASCAVCGMSPAKFPEWNAQVSFEDGHRAHFCSPGCATAYYADPGHFEEGRTRRTLLGAWVHDYDTKEVVDARVAYWVLETNADRIDAPMKTNPLPFAAESAAVAYVDQYDDLAAADVVRLADFDRELAGRYREQFL